MNIKVDDYLQNTEKWQKELSHLRSILLDCMLSEEFKWRAPCYTLKGKNLVLLARFKNYCALSFIKGVLLKDELSLLVAPGENSNSVRMFKFENLEDIKKVEPYIKAYILEAIDLQNAGVKIEKQPGKTNEIPNEILELLKQTPSLAEAFHQLTPGRQRGYLLFFNAAKQSKTKLARIKKYTSRILDGKGINDCTCGLSKRPPNCDGSHKSLQQ